MSNPNLRNITNHFLDAIWSASHRGTERMKSHHAIATGPMSSCRKVTTLETCECSPMNSSWVDQANGCLSACSNKLPVPERRAEFVFGTAAEVIQMMSDLPSKVVMFARPETQDAGPPQPGTDEMAAAIQAGKNQGAATSTKAR